MAEPLLTLKQVSKYYTGNRSVTVGLDNVSLSFSRGEFVAVTGESGSGKTTLSGVIGGILPYESGELCYKGGRTSHFDSTDWERYRRDNISYISQSYGILPNATVMKNVISALVFAGADNAGARRSAEKILRQAGLWELRHRRSAKLSSGQKQRLSIARALAKPAPILIADEPTGNLDPENSKTVISLLREAARDRLVILVTHEFDEVKDVVTRHIVLREGRVVSDTELSPVSAGNVENAVVPLAAVKRKRRSLSLYAANLQFSGRHVFTTIMISIFALTAFAVFAFLGVFIIALDDTSTRIYDNSAFLNGSMDRIAVMRGDAGAFTEEDHKAILSISHVRSIEPNGYVTDAQYAYRDGVDYVTTYQEMEDYGDGSETDGRYLLASFSLMDDMPFVKTVPILKDGDIFLTDGRLPENFYEAVTADPEIMIGDKVTVFLTDLKNWSAGTKVSAEMTVVGRTELGSGLYFHEDVGFFLSRAITVTERNDGYIYLPVSDLESNYFRGNPELFPKVSAFNYRPGATNDGPLSWYLDAGKMTTFRYIDENGAEQTHIGWSQPLTLDEYLAPTCRRDNGVSTVRYDPRRLVEVSYDFYDLIYKPLPDQISITIDGYAYTDRVISALAERGYTAVSPYRLGSTEQVPELAAERMQTLKICLGALTAVCALQILLLRAMFGLEKESYRLLSNIGLTGGTAKLSVIWQLAVFTVLGQLFGGLGIFICAQAGIPRIGEILGYLPPLYMMLLSGVHIAASALSAIWIISSLGRQVYPLSRKFSDITLNRGGKGGTGRDRDKGSQ